MENGIITSLICIFMLSAFVCCDRKPSKKGDLSKQATESFALSYEDGLDTCTAILVEHLGLDSIAARKKCLCLYNSYEEIDSTFPKMDPEVRQQFMMKYADEVIAKCDSLIPVKSNVKK